jgi:hypothetical protein
MGGNMRKKMGIVLYLFVFMFAAIAPSLPLSSNNTDNEDKDNITEREKKAHRTNKQTRQRCYPTDAEQAILNDHYDRLNAKDKAEKDKQIRKALDELGGTWDYQEVSAYFDRRGEKLSLSSLSDKEIEGIRLEYIGDIFIPEQIEDKDA